MFRRLEGHFQVGLDRGILKRKFCQRCACGVLKYNIVNYN
jgi:hypothetical protein